MSNLFDAKQANITTILAATDCTYQIPSYQRDYQWGSEHVERFYEDILQSSKEKKEYFIGSLVLINKPDKKIDVIDGQQRLTTIFLFLKAFRDIYNDKTIETRESARTTISRIDNAIFDLNGRETKIKIQTRKMLKGLPSSCESFDHFVHLSHADVKKSGLENIYSRNYLQLFNYLISLSPEGRDSLVNFLLYEVHVVRIDCQNMDDAIKIFDTINSTGVDLSQSDIIKARLMKSEADAADKSKLDEAMEEIDEKWIRMEETSSDIFGSQKSMDMMLGTFLLSHGNYGGGSLRDRFEKQHVAKAINISDLESFVNQASAINDEECRYINALKILKWEIAWMPILVEKKKSLDVKKYKIFKANFVRFIYSYYLAGRRSDSIMPIIAKMIKSDDKNNLLVTEDHIKNIQTLIESQNIYHGAARKKCVALLYLLETYYTEDTTNIKNESLSIDHLLPKSKNKEKNMIHSLGNLVLMSKTKNSSFGNQENLRAKKESYQNSGLRYSAESFNEDFDYLKVDQRQKKISEDIVKVLRGYKIS